MWLRKSWMSRSPLIQDEPSERKAQKVQFMLQRLVTSIWATEKGREVSAGAAFFDLKGQRLGKDSGRDFRIANHTALLGSLPFQVSSSPSPCLIALPS